LLPRVFSDEESDCRDEWLPHRRATPRATPRRASFFNALEETVRETGFQWRAFQLVEVEVAGICAVLDVSAPTPLQ
jgi:hypothetical protein